MSEMKALLITRYGGLGEALEFGNIAVPEPRDDEILIKVQAASINPIDFKLAAGYLQAIRPLNLPCALGCDVSGEVVSKGASVTGFDIGDAVFAYVSNDNMGTLAEYAVAGAAHAAKRPDSLTAQQAAGIALVALTSYQSLIGAADIQPGDKVLIHAGSGGIGTIAIQLAKLKGAYVATTTGTDNFDWVKDLGADVVIDYRTRDYRDVISDYDVVFDTLGGEYSLDAFKVLKTGGRVVTLAGPMDRKTAGFIGIPLPPEAVAVNDTADEKQALYKFNMTQPNGAQLAEIAGWCDDSKIQPVIDRDVPFEESKAALEFLASGRAKGKVVISMEPRG